MELGLTSTNYGLIVNCLVPSLRLQKNQKKIIDETFSYNHYPSRKEMEKLATELHISTYQVVGIFQRKRQKVKAQGFNSNNSGEIKITLVRRIIRNAC